MPHGEPVSIASPSAPATSITHWNTSRPANHTLRVWFAGLLVFQCVMLVAGALGDAIDTGSPWGIQEASRIASVLLGLRLRVLVPVTVIFSVAAIFASWPPSYCAEC